MDAEKRKRLEAAGFRAGTAAEFLGLSDGEAALVALRLEMGRAVRDLREKRGLTQAEVAKMAKTTQSRVARVEVAESDVSLDLMHRCLHALGGMLKVQNRRPGYRRPPATAAPARRRAAKSKATV